MRGFTLLCFLVSLAQSSRGQSSTGQLKGPPHAVSATVCEIVKSGRGFDGRFVTVRAFVVGGIPHGFSLSDDHCRGGLSMGSREPDSQDIEGYGAFLRAVFDAGGGFTETSKLRLTARFFGVLRYHPDQHAKWVLNVSKIGDIELKQNIKQKGNDSPPLVKN